MAPSFNRITVDGQESTNDMVARASATAPPASSPAKASLARLGRGPEAALLSLAVSIVADGEGSTRTMRLTVTGARDAGEAEAVARAVANSPLVKTAFYGRDANWGRIMQAIGQALGPRRPAGAAGAHRLRGRRDRGARPAGGAGRRVQQGRLTEVMHQPEIALNVALNGPGAEATVYFSDLTHDYVTLNAEYST